MADCFHIPECEFYHDRLDGMPKTAEFVKMHFCHKESETCARYLYLRHNRSNQVPKDLMPQDGDKIKDLLNSKG